MGPFLVGLGCLALALFDEPFRFRFERFIAWVIEPRALWFGALSAAVVIVLFRHWQADQERAYHYAGLTLELLGIGAVVWGISQKLKAFGRPGLPALAAGWLKQFLGIFRRPARHGMALSANMGTASSLITSVVRAWSKPSSLDALAEWMRTETIRLEGEIRACNAKIETERAERVAADEEVRKLFDQQIAQSRALAEKAIIGSFRDEIVGVIWLAMGTVISAISKELAVWWW